MLTSEEIQNHLNNLTKPPGSLGRLEELAVKLCEIQQTLQPQTSPRLLVLFAADHGVVKERITIWPSKVTELMIDNILSGGAASSVLARQTGTRLRLVDVGSLAGPRIETETYRFAQINKGTANLVNEPAMTTEQFKRAMAVGEEEITRVQSSGLSVVAAGEMGIGNSTAAACLAGLLCGLSAEHVVGRGAGADDITMDRKKTVVSSALKRVLRLKKSDTITKISSVSGFEIAAMAGFFIAAAKNRLTIVLDGFIATAAALVADTLYPGTAKYMIASHCSAEPGHIRMLETLAIRPLVDWSMRLGEGSGALIAMPMLDAAAAIVSEMATFQSAGIKHE